MLKIYVNKPIIEGPWGGGNKFVRCLINHLKESNYIVVENLTPDVNVIFCFDPRPNHQGLWYNDFLFHKKKYGSKIIQRVGDVGTHSKPDLTKLVIQTSQYSDFLIFPSLWAKNFINFNKQNFKIIHNAPMKIFYENRKIRYDQGETLNVVTHHWSTNPKKGFKTYDKIGKEIQLSRINWDLRYIGRYNEKYSSAGLNLSEPMSEKDLAIELPKNDIYLTSSEEEAGANHVLEAIACGLPIIYHKNGGSIPEYCDKYGVSHDGTIGSIVKAISKLEREKHNIIKNIKEYNEDIEDVVIEYRRIIDELFN